MSENSDLQTAVERLERAVYRFGRTRRAWRVAEALARGVALTGGALLLWFLLDWAFALPYLALLALFVALVVAPAPVWFWRPLRAACRRVRIEREALEIEARHGALDNALIGGLQLGRTLLQQLAAGHTPAFSPGLVDRLLAAGVRQTGDATLSGLVERGGARRNLWAAALVALALAVGGVTLREAWTARVDRLAEAWTQMLERVFPVTLEITPGSVALLRGAPVDLRLAVRGGRRTEATLLLTEADADGVLAATAVPAARRISLQDGVGSHPIAAIQSPLRYSFEYGRFRAGPFTIQVGDRPVLEALQYELIYPPYTGRPPRVFTGPLPSLAALAGTRVSVSFAATTDLDPDRTHVRWEDGMRQPVAVVGRFGHFAFTVDRADRAAIHMTGAMGAGFEAEQPEPLRITLQTDEPPFIRPRVRDTRLLLAEDAAAALALGWEATDDFGVAEVELHCRVEPMDALLGGVPRETTLTYRPEPVLPRVRGAFSDLFSEIDPPVPGERVVLRLLARDNNSETGPGVGRAAPVTIEVIGRDLAAFRERGRRGFGSGGLLGGLERISRRTDLLVMPTQTVIQQDTFEVERSRVRAQVDSGTGAAGAGDDAVGAYFRLLAGSEEEP